MQPFTPSTHAKRIYQKPKPKSKNMYISEYVFLGGSKEPIIGWLLDGHSYPLHLGARIRIGSRQTQNPKKLFCVQAVSTSGAACTSGTSSGSSPKSSTGGGTGDHSLALNKQHDIRCRISVF